MSYYGRKGTTFVDGEQQRRPGRGLAAFAAVSDELGALLRGRWSAAALPARLFHPLSRLKR